MRPDAFTNDIFGVVTDNSERVVAVTTSRQGDGYCTDEFQLERGFTFTVMGLGTTIQKSGKEKPQVEIVSSGKLTKPFK
ncbi:EF-hand domain-containing protein [Trichostrongylus colubriformis]|uniref:EF-hand domain-containing protein n=2 Tax=Trichostrongylus colubriformis TaxID=6319 RepID=A0AAN8ERC4_TRICO